MPKLASPLPADHAEASHLFATDDAQACQPSTRRSSRSRQPFCPLTVPKSASAPRRPSRSRPALCPPTEQKQGGPLAMPKPATPLRTDHAEAHQPSTRRPSRSQSLPCPATLPTNPRQPIDPATLTKPQSSTTHRPQTPTIPAGTTHAPPPSHRPHPALTNPNPGRTQPVPPPAHQQPQPQPGPHPTRPAACPPATPTPEFTRFGRVPRANQELITQPAAP
jgi:hypothetical protein